nr:transglutaminaseTgpA domain-containing protein [Actinomycetota bacterium]
MPPSSVLALAEVSLATLTVASVVGLIRLFDDASFLVAVLPFVITGHVVAASCRRASLPGWFTAAIAAGGLVVGVSVLLLPDTTTYGIPTGESLGEAARQLSAALAALRQVVAPAPVEPGFVLAVAGGGWLIAFLADSIAFRIGAAIEAAALPATVFFFGAALGAPDHRLSTTALFLAALLAYWLAWRVAGQWRAANRMGSDAGAESRWLLRQGGALAAAAVLLAVLIGPALPGAEATAVVPWRAADREEGSSRVTISPLVDIRARLLDQSDREVFTVAASARSYWRLTSLEIFDGRIWSSKGRYRKVEGRLATAVPDERADTVTAVQDFEIGDLASIWLPAAYAPVALAGVDARYDDDSGSLLTEEETASGLRYRVESELRDLEAAALAAVPAEAPPEVAEAYTALPPEFSTAVRQEAMRVVDGAATPYDQALRLQNHFRDGAFAYDLSVPPGHGGDDLERFLFETRRGYCEQFAGAYAAMARSVGLPARVAVGFTPGEPGEDGRLHVRDLNAHSWPEVFLSGYGWVAFEPTPGRGIPGAERYTGVPEQQAVPEDRTTATTAPATSPTSVPAPAGGDAASPSVPDVADDPAAPAPGANEEASPWPGRLLLAVAAAVGLPVAWA